MSKHSERWARAIARIADFVGQHEALAIVNDRTTAVRMDKVADQVELIAYQIESWLGEECNDNGFAGSCGCSKCLAGAPRKDDSTCLEF